MGVCAADGTTSKGFLLTKRAVDGAKRWIEDVNTCPLRRATLCAVGYRAECTMQQVHLGEEVRKDGLVFYGATYAIDKQQLRKVTEGHPLEM
jgi:hypothetical protein